jgi:hypothetical protein
LLRTSQVVGPNDFPLPLTALVARAPGPSHFRPSTCSCNPTPAPHEDPTGRGKHLERATLDRSSREPAKVSSGFPFLLRWALEKVSPRGRRGIDFSMYGLKYARSLGLFSRRTFTIDHRLPPVRVEHCVPRFSTPPLSTTMSLVTISSGSRPTEDNVMPKMSDSRRKRIQAKQRKATNALQRAAKLAKRNRNNAKRGAAAG